jgi:hypothetical protein
MQQMEVRMERALELAGFFAAHAVWCVSDGETLCTLLGQESAAKGRNMVRFALERVEDGVAKGQAYLDANPESSDHAALIYDGYLTSPSGRTDALLIVVRSYAPAASTLTLAIPYRSADCSGGFAVHRPKFIDWQGAGDPDHQALGEAFSRGIESHEKGRVVWHEALDDSI